MMNIDNLTSHPALAVVGSVSSGNVSLLLYMLSQRRELNRQIDEILGVLTESDRLALKSLIRENEAMQSLIDADILDVISSDEGVSVVVTPIKRAGIQVDDNIIQLPEYLTTEDVAEIEGVSPQTIRLHCKNNEIKAWRTPGARGEWRIDVSSYVDHPNFNRWLFAKWDTKRDLRNALDEIDHKDSQA